MCYPLYIYLFRITISQHLYSEIVLYSTMKQFCVCGCGQSFECKEKYNSSPKKFIREQKIKKALGCTFKRIKDLS